VTHSLPEAEPWVPFFSAFASTICRERRLKNLFTSALHDHAIGALVAARLLAERREAHGVLRVMPLTFLHHRRAGDPQGSWQRRERWTNTFPARAAGHAVVWFS